MKITYDLEGDALYILLREAKPEDSFDLNPGITVDIDEKGEIIGVEIIGARERGIFINDLHLENLPYSAPSMQVI